MPRKPRGTLVRNVPDWYCEKLFGSEISVGAVAGQASNCGIYNSSKTGGVIYVYSVDIFASGNTFINFKVEFGQNYSAYAPEAGAPIDPRIGSGFAIPEAGTFAGCKGTHVGGVNYTGQARTYAPGWPFLIAPPGYAAVIETRNNNLTLEIGIHWLELRGGGF